MNWLGWTGMILMCAGALATLGLYLYGAWKLSGLIARWMKRRITRWLGVAANGRVALVVLPALSAEPQVWRGRVYLSDDNKKLGRELFDLLVDCDSDHDKYLLVGLPNDVAVDWPQLMVTDLYLDFAELSPDKIDAQRMVNYFSPSTALELRAELGRHLIEMSQRNNFWEGLAY